VLVIKLLFVNLLPLPALDFCEIELPFKEITVLLLPLPFIEFAVA
jgi:hypothetical protein